MWNCSERLSRLITIHVEQLWGGARASVFFVHTGVRIARVFILDGTLAAEMDDVIAVGRPRERFQNGQGSKLNGMDRRIWKIGCLCLAMYNVYLA